MKRILAIIAIVVSAITAQSAVAQPMQLPHVSEAAYGESFDMSCYVNGVTYPVDSASNVWARNGFGNWFIIGQLVNNGSRYFVVRTDGVTFAATCY